ncbi:MAG: sigma-54-dependent Fis family transcriptional regulator [Rhodocyclaceae bacterium]|nr:sigma-54-dependent Fis family transcriptional regulator [Rhodocyclaceae bacterium]
MSGLVLPVETREARIREARRAFLDGNPQKEELAVTTNNVVKSWQRCRQSGLDNGVRGSDIGCAANTALKEARDRNDFLLSHSRGILNHLYEQIRSTGSVVILSDSTGMVLESLGDPEFVDRANQVALRPGASWAETLRGTNAVGTALVEQRPIEIVGSEHYFDCNSFLTCSASPIFDAGGRLLGALDISGDYRSHQRHTLGLVRLTSQILEKRLFEAEFAQELLVFFHTGMEYVGTLQEGVLSFTPDGTLLAANRPAIEALSLNRAMMRQLDFGMIFEGNFGDFVDRAARDPHTLSSLALRHGGRVFARMRVPVHHNAPQSSMPLHTPRVEPAPARHARKCEAPETPTLSCLDTGDGRLRAAVQRASKVVGKDIPLLILGESGVGKEMFAKAFHHSGPRRDKPFVALNCAAIPENLIESELFGYVGGAFTGARKEGYTGKIQQASGGTLFLDEIGDMPLSLQARLLRVLQERIVVPLGGVKAVPVDISLVCATHRNLPEAVRSGVFRQDLYYRVNGLTVTLPALRERSDIRSLIETIIDLEIEPGRDVVVSEEVHAFFARYGWPGNIRQLQNVLRVALALLDDDERVITATHLPEELFAIECDSDASSERFESQGSASIPPQPAMAAMPGASVGGSGESLEAIELRAIERVLAECQGNVSAAARRLGISRNTLYRKLGRM